MTQVNQQYVPSKLPSRYDGESVDDYVARLVKFLTDEFNDIYKETSQGARFAIETTSPRLPYDGMVRYFIYDSGIPFGWAPGSSPASGLYMYMSGTWYKVSLTAV